MLSSSLPRADFARFDSDPLRYLVEARAELGDIFVLRERGPIFSRTPDCNGVIAVFGDRQRAVLTDIDTFAMPPSAARQLALPETLAKLNRSLHSMQGEEHAVQKRVASAVLDASNGNVECDVTWEPGESIDLMAEMRALAARLASRVLFGNDVDPALTQLLENYFHLRREAAASGGAAIAPGVLIETGAALDLALRDFIRSGRGDGVIARLARTQLTEDDIAGHANIFFISATEPVAVSLAWTLLILSQTPQLRQQLRDDPSRIEHVLLESHRLLPPNAFMVRITEEPAMLSGVELPARCEIVLSPFVAHRDPRVFPDPERFAPSRWEHARPSSFDYLPFGAGGHACIGRGLAASLMRSALAFLIARYDLVLDGDQEVDWRVHIQFMPRGAPRMVVRAPRAMGAGGRLRGPIADLVRLDFAANDGVQ